MILVFKPACFVFYWSRMLCFFGLILPVAFAEASKLSAPSLKDMVAQKLLIDLRYYCENTAEQIGLNNSKRAPINGNPQPVCQNAVTILPKRLADLLSETKVGGVILFTENLTKPEQILQLTHSLQQAALKGQDTPLYIAIDQEGGRVSRLPNDVFFGFSGNMAIGATHAEHGSKYAVDVANNMAKSLYALGFNVNFAPSLDVNSNPHNPIINVRSFSQDPSVVAQLGTAQIKAFQAQNIAAAAKHFPGHGDTYVDSHVGLPRVNHSKAQINAIDIYPFRQAIEHADVDMIMTAHIQYPALDDTLFRSKTGINTELPATLSKKVLTGLLRNELHYPGLIVTDALDMVAISQFLTPAQATLKAFSAGADIALMPFRISSEQEAQGFIDFLDDITALISTNDVLKKKVLASYERIVSHKQKRNMLLQAQAPLAVKREQLAQVTKTNDSQRLAITLAKAAITELKPVSAKLNPSQSIYAIMPDKRRCEALTAYLKKARFSRVECLSQLSQPINTQTAADVILIADVLPALSFFESKAFEGITPNQRKDVQLQQVQIHTLLANSPQQTKILLKLRSPYLDTKDTSTFDGIYASYDYQVAGEGTSLFSPAFAAFVAVITGQITAPGIAPVDVVLPGS
jgi:beta-N-acetylhexosaminidase